MLQSRKWDINDLVHISGRASMLIFGFRPLNSSLFIVLIESLSRLLDNKEINLQSVH